MKAGKDSIRVNAKKVIEFSSKRKDMEPEIRRLKQRVRIRGNVWKEKQGAKWMLSNMATSFQGSHESPDVEPTPSVSE